MKFSRASSRVKILQFCDVSGTDSVPETSENFNILTRLLARETFVGLIRLFMVRCLLHTNDSSIEHKPKIVCAENTKSNDLALLTYAKV